MWDWRQQQDSSGREQLPERTCAAPTARGSMGTSRPICRWRDSGPFTVENIHMKTCRPSIRTIDLFSNGY